MNFKENVLSKEYVPDIQLGNCCCCLDEEADHVLQLSWKLPTQYRPNGWRCGVCEAKNGAMSVACSKCVNEEADIKQFVAGDIDDKNRKLVENLKYELHHDQLKHKQYDDQLRMSGYIFPGDKKGMEFNFDSKLFGGVALQPVESPHNYMTFIDTVVKLYERQAVYDIVPLLEAEVRDIGYEGCAFVRPHGALAGVLIEHGYQKHLQQHGEAQIEAYRKPKQNKTSNGITKNY